MIFLSFNASRQFLMRRSRRHFARGFYFLLLAVLLASCGFHRPEIKVLPQAQSEKVKTLFIAFDGISTEMMRDLQAHGHFTDFSPVTPLVTTFPSATTIGFTGIFKPLDVGKVQGYEVRFYSYPDDRIIGGTPKDIYRIHINYKTYFDTFRHTMKEKGMMYAFPGVAGVNDLKRTHRLLMTSPKKILMTYLGGTDGGQHMLGYRRTYRFMIWADDFLKKMKIDYEKQHREKLRIVIFSDHGFHFGPLKMISPGTIDRVLEKGGYRVSKKLGSERDVVLAPFGLLTGGVAYNKPDHEAQVAKLVSKVKGIDLVFWPEGRRIHIVDSLGKEAYFEYRGLKNYRYVMVSGDPLGYETLLRKSGKSAEVFYDEALWQAVTSDAPYPDAGYRLYDSFHHLVENKATVMFSVKPNYQYGAVLTLLGTRLRIKQKGTHGGLFREDSQGIVMTDDKSVRMPAHMRYDQMFPFFLPKVSEAYRRGGKKSEIQFLAQPAHAH